MGLKKRPRTGQEPADAEMDDKPGLAARQVATRLLSAVVVSQTSLDGLTDRKSGHPAFRRLDGRDQSLVRAILVSALRRRGTLDAILSQCLERPLPGNADALHSLLHTAMAQILFLDVPDSAAVDLAVSQTHVDPRLRRFAGLVNAILRRVARERDVLIARQADPLVDMPKWLQMRLLPAYGAEALAFIATAHRAIAPVDITVRDGDAALWAERLGGHLLPFGTVRMEADPSRPVQEMPGFEEGAWWVQDAAAAIPARLFGSVSGARIADLCAAPGGKTAQLAAAGAEVTAMDISASRLARLEENFKRLRLPIKAVQGDIRQADIVSGGAFDGVLLDAPCSSTGTIRRHPDVAYTKSAEEVDKLAAVQADLLRHAARAVRPGGLLVFSNCSLDPAEGEAVVEAFLAEHSDYRRKPITADELPGLEAAISPVGDVRTTPAMAPDANPALAGMDGFYAARLLRQPATGG
ncbi:methyltransferase domain-containing protein [Aureimonas altamirensis]|uniref:RsmB/NOP family class I SAM-dependent RNA methyltransferase n=1 Tax=Aureimonas altamirensis TaxID=370622 RepID=UPI001E52F916|nr:transcription antitermination factor NusB [Aureimonas altamirensis]UHD46186.1 methyltransferase domain-containing protein [Aureimonas altamirensis]